MELGTLKSWSKVQEKPDIQGLDGRHKRENYRPLWDINSYGYRDVDGSKVHMAIREPYGEPYVEGDVIGFYINLPNGEALAPKSASLVSYKGHPYIIDQNEEPPKVVSGM